ncbi:SHOCT domain-containing protein [Halorubellus sp. JP-L1]|uniref:SHOCT domain-containing protein n=1 Tax=Halorubellus sp. JP-L1 TaxID=2715753 RepID=UPI001408DF5D|nr:SHOCT domain-containing protein [Halorubellus sp. JP-L1]NHN42262.1 SHOCT domain-containing protein [Halorubellus sp. JP-L1]
MADHSGSRSYTGAVSLLVLGVALTGLFLGVENWWVAFVVGYGVIVPLVGMLTGEEPETDEETDDGRESVDAPREASNVPGSKADALDTLRDRYARGELSEAQFERKLERLLETETLEDARDTVDRHKRDRADAQRTTDESTDRELEYE